MSVRFSVAKKIVALITLAFAAMSAFAGVQPIQEVFEPKGTFDERTHGKVAVVQWAPSETAPLDVPQTEVNAYKRRLRDQIENYIREAARNGAKWVVTPEFGLTGYPDIPELPNAEDTFQTPAQVRPFAEAIPGPYSNFFGRLAKELGIWIQVGYAENDNGTFYNAAVVLNPQGTIAAKYRKINLFELENDSLIAGKNAVTYQSPWGKVGIIICADVYSSKPMSDYKRAGVDVLALSTSWARYNSGWGVFTRAARDTNAYLLAANQSYYPDSGVINRDGSAQSHIRQSTGIAYGYLPYKTTRANLGDRRRTLIRLK
jgi:predicted amidohydrolase